MAEAASSVSNTRKIIPVIKEEGSIQIEQFRGEIMIYLLSLGGNELLGVNFMKRFRKLLANSPVKFLK